MSKNTFEMRIPIQKPLAVGLMSKKEFDGTMPEELPVPKENTKTLEKKSKDKF